MTYNNPYALRKLLVFVWLPFSRINLKSLNFFPTHFSFLKIFKKHICLVPLHFSTRPQLCINFFCRCYNFKGLFQLTMISEGVIFNFHAILPTRYPGITFSVDHHQLVTDQASVLAHSRKFQHSEPHTE